jgi:hypothetical protein
MRAVTKNRVAYVLVGAVGTSIGCGASSAVLYSAHYPIEWMANGFPAILVALLALLVWQSRQTLSHFRGMLLVGQLARRFVLAALNLTRMRGDVGECLVEARENRVAVHF